MASKTADAEHLTFDLDQLTLGDIVDIEDVAGISFQGLDMGKPPMKVVAALVWIFKRKQDPSFTYADARAMPVSEVNQLRAVATAEPTSPKGERGTKPRGSASSPTSPHSVTSMGG